MRIALAGWSINRRFRRDDNPLQLLDFPRVAREEFGFDAVELNSPFFESKDPEYLDQLLAEGQKHGVAFTGMAVDGTGDPASTDEAERQEAVELIRAWFPVAQRLGLPFFRANTGGRGKEDNPEAFAASVKSFRELAAEAESAGVKLVIENHGGISATPEKMVALVKAVDSPAFGTLPDFGNFPAEIRYDGIAQIAPYALGVHAKMLEFDENGEEPNIDIGRLVKIIHDSGYQGDWGIEYEGPGDDHEGVLKSKALLEKHLHIA